MGTGPLVLEVATGAAHALLFMRFVYDGREGRGRMAGGAILLHCNADGVAV